MDSRTVSIIGSPDCLAKLGMYATKQGLLMRETAITGKWHNPENGDLAQHISMLLKEIDTLQLPSAKSLKAPVRSNRTGQYLTDQALTEEIVLSMISTRCEWLMLMENVARSAKEGGHETLRTITFGTGDSVPSGPFYKYNLDMQKYDVYALFIKDANMCLESGFTSSVPVRANDVAVIGVSCRVAGARTMQELWKLVKDGTDNHIDLSNSRIDASKFFRYSQSESATSFYGNFIDDVESFDNKFFGISDKESANMDPQQRLLLELAYEALESSGYCRGRQLEKEKEKGGAVGCFIGASMVEYLDNTSSHPPSAYTSTGTIRAFMSGRISYHFGWTGPSEVLDTACSSSLVAVNRACKAIQSGECSMALAGGANIMTGINNFIDLSKAGFLSPTGQCKPFDIAADGYCRADGAGLVVLKSLEAALRDGDPVMSVITGVSTNQSGLSKSIVSPHVPAQTALFQHILDQSSLSGQDVTYVEAHGTGTQAGDPIEMNSIRQVFGGENRENVVNVGSVKGNIGHCETAAGIIGLIKVIAMLFHCKIPLQANFRTLNPKISTLRSDHIEIPQETRAWRGDHLVACVSSYGAAGSNCALICQGGPWLSDSLRSASCDANIAVELPVILCAASSSSLRSYSETLVSYLNVNSRGINFLDIAYTLNERRKRFKNRLIVQASSNEELVNAIKQSNGHTIQRPIATRSIVITISGQHSSFFGLNRTLYESIPRFRFHVDQCEDILRSLGCPSVVSTLDSATNEIVLLQTAIFTQQYACAQCWIESGIQVDAVIGHSFGELTALAISGVLSTRDCLRLIAQRAALIRDKWSLDRGAMVAVQISREDALALIEELQSLHPGSRVEIACYNARTSQVLAGTTNDVSLIESIIIRRGVRYKRLKTTHAFHCHLTEPALQDLVSLSNSLEWNSPKLPLQLCTWGNNDEIFDFRPAEHLRQAVYFEDAVQRIEARLGDCLWVEAGVDSPIMAMVQNATTRQQSHSFLAINSGDGCGSTLQSLANVIQELWRDDHCVSHWLFLDRSDFKQVWLPPYQFDKRNHWVSNVDRAYEMSEKARFYEHEAKLAQDSQNTFQLIARESDSPNEPGLAKFRIHTKCSRFEQILCGHAVRNRPLCPASLYAECVLMAYQELGHDYTNQSIIFENFSFKAPLSQNSTRSVRISLDKAPRAGSLSFEIFSHEMEGSKKGCRTIHASGNICTSPSVDRNILERLLQDKIGQLSNEKDCEILYSKSAYSLFGSIVDYQPFLKGLHRVQFNLQEALAQIRIPRSQPAREQSTAVKQCDAVSFDTFIQVLGLHLNTSENLHEDEVMVASSIGKLSISPDCDTENTNRWIVYTRYHMNGTSAALGDVFVFTPSNVLVASLTDCKFSKVAIRSLEKVLDSALEVPREEKGLQASANKGSVAKSLGKGFSNHSGYTSLSDRASTVVTMTPASSDSALSSATMSRAQTMRSILSSFIGIDETEIPLNVSLGSLGLDSLGAEEMTQEIASSLNLFLTSGDVQTLTLHDILNKSEQESHKYNENIVVQGSMQSLHQPTSQAHNNDYYEANNACSTLFKLLSEASGSDAREIGNNQSLADIGIDSLGLTEVENEIKTLFPGRIAVNQLALEMRVEELLHLLGINAAEDIRGHDTSFMESHKPQESSHHAIQSVNRAAANENGPLVQELPQPILSDIQSALLVSNASVDTIMDKQGVQQYWNKVLPEQDSLVVAYILMAFKDLGSDMSLIPPGCQIRQVRHIPKFKRLVRRMWEILEQHRLVTESGGSWVRTETPVPLVYADEILRTLNKKYPRCANETALISRAGPALADCISGKCNTVSLLFGSSSAMECLSEYYRSSPILTALTQLLVTTINTWLSNPLFKGQETVNILEVGAGTGGTTQELIKVLQESTVPVRYTFTDISRTLVQKASARYSDYGWMNFETFDLEKAPPLQFTSRFDIVIGTNCVHATSSRVATLARLHQTLKPHGVVALSEVTRVVNWYDIVFGLLEGWWLAEGGTEYPLQPAEVWEKYFRKAGFDAFACSRGISSESTGQQLLVGYNRITHEALTTPNKQRNSSGQPSARPWKMRTFTYNVVNGCEIDADVYIPSQNAKDSPLSVGRFAVNDLE